MYSIILVRHGETLANRYNLYGSNEDLTFLGKRQARKAKKRYKALNIDRWYSSRLYRTTTTGLILNGDFIPTENQFEEFDEIGFGDLKGTKILPNYEEDLYTFCLEHGGDDVHKRGRVAVRKIRELLNSMQKYPEVFPNKRIGIVTSDTLIRCIISTILSDDRWSKPIVDKHLKNLEGADLLFNDKLDFHSFSDIN